MNIQIIVSQSEYDKLKCEAEAHSLSLSSYLRTKVLNTDNEIDKFYVRLIESFKSNFDDNIEYNGKIIKAFSNGLIQRIL